MTDEIPKPKRKRWRWIIAGVLLFVAVLGGLWYWPRGDARFVGKWTYSEEVNGQLAPHYGVWTLHRNGSGMETEAGLPRDLYFQWEVKGDQLTFGAGLDVQRFPLAHRINLTIQRLAGRCMLLNSWRYRIIEVQPSTVRLESLETPQTIVLTRVPE